MQASQRTAQHRAVRSPSPVVIGHRGAPAYRPEHTLASFELALDLGADRIEPDIVVSRDGALVVRHESELSRSTDIASRPEFADRRTTREVGGASYTGWFAEDLTLAELRTLRAVERMPTLRPLNSAYDGRFGLLTLADVVALARRRSTPERPVRVHVELKHPTEFEERGLPVLELLVAELRRLDACTAGGPVVVMGFDTGALRRLRAMVGSGGPEILQLIDDTAALDHLTTPVGLREVSTYAQGIGPSRHRILLRGEDDALVGVSELVDRAHHAGLSVMPWTLRPENAFLPRHLRRGEDPSAHGDAQGEARLLFALGCDGVISDAPDTAVRARNELAASV